MSFDGGTKCLRNAFSYFRKKYLTEKIPINFSFYSFNPFALRGKSTERFVERTCSGYVNSVKKKLLSIFNS